MTATAIREKLYDYIKVADDKKVEAIYNLLEGQIVEDLDWHNNKAFLAELDSRVKHWEENPGSASTVEEVQEEIKLLKLKRAGK